MRFTIRSFGITKEVKVILRPTVSRHVCLGIGCPSGIPVDSYGFVDVRCPLWREVGSVVFSFCWASTEKPFSGLCPTEFISIFYCLYFWDSPNLEGQIPAFISPRNGIAQLYHQALSWYSNPIRFPFITFQCGPNRENLFLFLYCCKHDLWHNSRWASQINKPANIWRWLKRKHLVASPRWVPDTKTDLPTDCWL
jgi:hypothetical protein